MKLISDKESTIANTLNEKRLKAYIDIYKETNFTGLGILVDEELNVYKYGWNIVFKKETNSFSNNNYLYECPKKISYEKLESYLLSDLYIIEKEYENDATEDEQYNEIIKLKTYVNEFFNKDLYNKIKEKISDMIEEDL